MLDLINKFIGQKAKGETKMVLQLEVKRKTFQNDNGDNIPYIAYETELDGVKFSFVPRAEDKKLLTYLIENKEKENGPTISDAELESLAGLSIPADKGGKK